MPPAAPRDEVVFRRATEVALQARAGDQALAAVLAWREAVPGSVEALRYHVQMLVALNRVAEAEEPLGKLLRQAARPALPGMIAAVPRFLGRSSDRAATALLIERALQPYADAPDTRVAALVAMGRGWLPCPTRPRRSPTRRRPPRRTRRPTTRPCSRSTCSRPCRDAEAIVKARLAASPPAPAGLRLLYVRTLASSQRLTDAQAQVTALTQSEPTLAPPWLTLGAIELELKHPKEATVALETYVRLVEGGAAVGSGPAPAVVDDDGDDDVPATASAALTQAWLLLAQAAEQQRDFAAAERWLAKIDNPQRALEVQSRRASLLAKQGKMAEARQLIRRVPEQTVADARAKYVAEAELLRDAKQWAEADKVLAAANKAFPNDTDLLYEQAMVVEKLEQRRGDGAAAAPGDRAQAEPSPCLQRPRLFARRAQAPPARGAQR